MARFVIKRSNIGRKVIRNVPCCAFVCSIVPSFVRASVRELSVVQSSPNLVCSLHWWASLVSTTQLQQIRSGGVAAGASWSPWCWWGSGPRDGLPWKMGVFSGSGLPDKSCGTCFEPLRAIWWCCTRTGPTWLQGGSRKWNVLARQKKNVVFAYI